MDTTFDTPISAKPQFRKPVFDELLIIGVVLIFARLIPPSKPMQIPGNALAVNEIEWAKKYIETYIPMLKPSY